MITTAHSKPILSVHSGMVWFYNIVPANNPAITLTEPMTLETAKARLEDLKKEYPTSQNRILKNGMDIEAFINTPYAQSYLLEVLEGRA